MDEALLERARSWQAEDPDPDTAAELGRLIDAQDEAELRERFAGRLEFGTAGLRGLLGAGPNRMNRAVVRQTTAGLARYLLGAAPEAKRRGVLVARDARRQSDVFAEDTACVLAAHGIPALVLPEPAPTPVGAFALLDQGAAAGVVVTASHNPPEYNGYKVYWCDGAQIVPPHDTGIATAILEAGPARDVPLMSGDTAREKGLIRELGPEVGRRYLDRVLALRRHPGVGTDVGVVYTPLHGVGGRWVERALADGGFRSVHTVAEQREPDGAFPTVRFPNPEEPGALDLAFALAEREGADLILANDPDADRLAAVVRDGEGALRPLTGDEVGVLLGHYLLTEGPPRTRPPLVLTTIVSSQQLGAIARELGARCDATLTGFRWVANRAMQLEDEEGLEFVFGYEEALGYSVGPLVRDKDGVSAALLFAELAGWCRSRGSRVLAHLEQVQQRHGVYLSAQRSFTLPGVSGAERIRSVLAAFRSRPPESIGPRPVVGVRDYERGTVLRGGGESPTGLPRSNVIAYELEDGSRVTLRPSGTEPKIKYYFEVRVAPGPDETVATARDRGRDALEHLIDDFLGAARERGQALS